MEMLGKNYLQLQFKDKIHSKNGREFQSFFESIMEKAFPDFQKIKPNGKEGDAGNDGYRKNLGIYYQVYAPETPLIKQNEAATKLKNDFEKLKDWNKISEIKEYCFVFNDKYSGSTQKIEKAVAELKNNNPNIKFGTLLAKDLEKIFFKLNKSDISSLEFDVDSKKTISFAYHFLQNVEIELYRENSNFALKMLENIEDIAKSLEDEKLTLEYELLKCRCLQKIEKIDEAKEKYENIIKMFPDDPRAFLYLAEIYRNNMNLDKNKELLEKAEKINKDNWLLKLEQLKRKYQTGEQIASENVDENTFPQDDPKIKANFYRLYALSFEDLGEKNEADSFIEKAIYANSEGFSNYLDKLLILEKRLISEQQDSRRSDKAHELLGEIKKVEDKFFEYGDIGKRNKAILNLIKLNVLLMLEDSSEIEKIFKETFELFINCYFDKEIEQMITTVLPFFLIPDDDLNNLLNYIKNSKRAISDEFSKVLIFQFNIKESLFTDGRKFFTEINNQNYVDFINLIESKKYTEVLKFLEGDILLSKILAGTLKNFPELRSKIIEALPNDKNISKEKLLLLLNYNEKDFDEAFNIVKKLDLSQLTYFECEPILQIAEQKKAWDFVVVILQKLIKKEKNEDRKFNFQLRLFNAYVNLKQYPKVIEIGKQLLEIDFNKKYLDIRNKEALLANTITACLERGKKIDDNFYREAKTLLEKYQLSEPSFEFKIKIEPEVYLNNNDPQTALKTIIEGVKIKKILSPQEYANLYLLLIMKMGDKIDLNSLDEVKENTFVKLKNKDQWYFIGDENELDAIKITTTNDKYLLFNKKKLGDKIVFKGKYGTKEGKDSIEFIFPIEKYILWQAVQNFQKLSKYHDLEGVQIVEVPQKGETINPENILKFMSDLNKKTEPFFGMYCKNNFPLAVLAVNESGFINAISRIQNEQKGFINFSTNNMEFEKQKEVARTILKEGTIFYLDGTSAMFLSEIDYLEKIYRYIPNVKVPQSVINLLAEVIGKFTYIGNQIRYMGYAQGKIKFSTIDKNKSEQTKNNLIKSIKLLESNHNNIQTISDANKNNCFSEKKVPPELSDACILAQKEEVPILTEDFLYLEMNKIETKKEVPKYFSSLALLRVLYEDGKITFNEYINYFEYLSFYRFRFLPLNVDDIEKTVLGDGKIKILNAQNIKKLNFPLTLSEEYGVTFKRALEIITKFLFKILTDNSITPDIAQKIFIEIIESFPTKLSKSTIVQLFLLSVQYQIEKIKSESIIIFESKSTREKIDLLFNIYV